MGVSWGESSKKNPWRQSAPVSQGTLANPALGAFAPYGDLTCRFASDLGPDVQVDLV